MENSQDTKLRNYILKNSPYGETKSVLDDLTKLIPNFKADDPSIANILKDHNEEHLAIVSGLDDKRLLVVSKNNFADGSYVDQKSKTAIKVNAADLKIESKESTEVSLSSNLEAYRNALDEKCNAYIQSFYKDDNCGYDVTAKGDDHNFTIFISMTSKNLNLKNYYGGEWNSEWKITNSKIDGTVKINAHYFEDGNVQLKVNKTYSSSSGFSDPEKDAAKAFDFIRTSENQLLSSLGEMYDSLPTEVFKTMRKEIPCN